MSGTWNVAGWKWRDCMAQWVTGIEPSKLLTVLLDGSTGPFLAGWHPDTHTVKHVQMASPVHLYPGWFWWCHNSHRTRGWPQEHQDPWNLYMRMDIIWDLGLQHQISGQQVKGLGDCQKDSNWLLEGLICCALCHPAVGNWRNEMYAQIEWKI